MPRDGVPAAQARESGHGATALCRVANHHGARELHLHTTPPTTTTPQPVTPKKTTPKKTPTKKTPAKTPARKTPAAAAAPASAVRRSARTPARKA